MSEFDFNVILRALPFLWTGMQLTLLLTALATAAGIVLGTILAMARLWAPPPFSQLAAGYVNLLRSMPLILVVFWFYFLVPLAVGRAVGAFPSALIAFAMFEAAYYCEIIRTGIQGVGRGQLAAAQASGLTHLKAMRYVVLPQAFRAMVPILLTQSIILFQDTSLVYVVGLHDFLTAATVVAGRDNRVVELYSFVAVVYLALSVIASFGVRRLQSRFGK